MLETSARLLRLLSLLQAHREWSGADLADRLDVSARTLRRDVGRVRRVGGPVGSCGGNACFPCPPVSALVRGGETEWLRGALPAPLFAGPIPAVA